jgi:predicted nucleic acid-binding protein
MVLLGARMRFSPTGASVREEAIDRVLEQNLAFADQSGLTEEELREIIRLPGGNRILTSADVHAGLSRLIGRGHVQEKSPKGSGKFILSSNVEHEIEQTVHHAKKRWDCVVKDLFTTAKGPLNQYADAFVEVLCHVFTRVSSGYVAVLVGKDTQHADTHHFVHRAIEAVLKSRAVADKQAFDAGVSRFFRESTPQFDAIKWNMAQNFYVAIALGIDPKARILSSELMAGAIVYLDTNVLIAGLIPEDRHHGGFQEVVNTCRDLGMKMMVAQITVDELRRVVAAHAAVLKQVYDRIPVETRSRVRCFLLESYLQLVKENPDLKLDEFLNKFQAPIDSLRDAFNLEIDDDAWFDNERNSPATEDLAKKLSAKFHSMRSRPKNSEAARHDALLLRWVDERRRGIDANCRITTLDMTLVAAERDAFHIQPRAISLDALLQWASPHCSSDATVEQVAAIYSTALKYHLLPTEQFLDARDFRVFAEMEIETAQLPVEDVEACVREIRKVGPNLDPGKAEDREKIAKTIQRFFADPGTKFKKALADLEAKNNELSQALSNETESRKRSEKDLGGLSERNAQLDEAISGEKSARQTAEAKITTLQTDLEALKKQVRRGELTRSVVVRCLLLGIALVLAWAVVSRTALERGAGETGFDKLTNAWPWFSLPVAIVGIAFPFVMGRERMQHLKWWKGESD